MKQKLNSFILHIPTLFIKQYPYTWILAAALWTWPPFASAAIFLIVILGILSLHWRAAAWISSVRREHGNEALYVERLPIPIPIAIRNIAILLIIAGLSAWLLHQSLHLGFWQTYVMIVGFCLCYIDTYFFGGFTIYIVTATGIAIYYIPGHVDYRLFIRFKEIRQIARLGNIEKIPASWSVCARLRKATRGLLLVPRSPAGFSPQLQEILLTPLDTDEFLKRVPSTLVTNGL